MYCKQISTSRLLIIFCFYLKICEVLCRYNMQDKNGIKNINKELTKYRPIPSQIHLSDAKSIVS